MCGCKENTSPSESVPLYTAVCRFPATKATTASFLLLIYNMCALSSASHSHPPHSPWLFGLPSPSSQSVVTLLSILSPLQTVNSAAGTTIYPALIVTIRYVSPFTCCSAGRLRGSGINVGWVGQPDDIYALSVPVRNLPSSQFKPKHYMHAFTTGIIPLPPVLSFGSLTHHHPCHHHEDGTLWEAISDGD